MGRKYLDMHELADYFRVSLATVKRRLSRNGLTRRVGKSPSRLLPTWKAIQDGVARHTWSRRSPCGSVDWSIEKLWFLFRPDEDATEGDDEEDERQYVYKSTVMREYGLTPSMVEELGPPDDYCENPHYRSGPEASLYRVERVEQWVEANKERVEKAAHELRKLEQERKLAEWVGTVEITVTKPLPENLLHEARKHFQFGKEPDILKQGALRAYVREHLTNYGDLLWAGHVTISQLRASDQRTLSRTVRQALKTRVDVLATEAIREWKEAMDMSPKTEAA
jgi:hypothetical protein